MKTIYFAITLTLCIILSSIMLLQHTNASVDARPSGIVPIDLKLNKESYFSGESVFINGKLWLINATHVTISIEKNHNLIVTTKNVTVSENKTFATSFTIPKDVDAKNWSVVATANGDTLIQDLNFYPVPLSPLEQFKSGVAPKDIKCNTGFILVLKQDYAPACIKEPSAIKLFLRGWIFGFADYQPVYFMKHNMHAEISVKYSPSNHGSMSSDLLDLYPRTYSKTNSNYPTDAIYANANPDMVSQNADTVVKYTVMAQNDTHGVYWLSLGNICELVPIAVDVDESNLTISDLQSPATAWKCPGSMMQYHVIGVSGATVGLIPIRN